MAHHPADASARASTSRILTCWSMSTSGPPQARGMGMRKTPLSRNASTTGVVSRRAASTSPARSRSSGAIRWALARMSGPLMAGSSAARGPSASSVMASPVGCAGLSDGSAGELGGDGSAVQPDVLAADLAVPEFPDMQHPETDRAAVAGDAHEGPRDGRVDDVFHHGEIRAEPIPHHDHVLDLEIVDEVLIEPLSGVRTGQHAHRGSDHIVLHVVGVDRDRPGGVTSRFTA